MSTTTVAVDIFGAYHVELEAGRLDEAVQFFTPSAQVLFTKNGARPNSGGNDWTDRNPPLCCRRHRRAVVFPVACWATGCWRWTDPEVNEVASKRRKQMP